MSSDPLGGGLDDDVGSVLDRTGDVSALSEGVVHDQRELKALGHC